jgi:hypothetical protein
MYEQHPVFVTPTNLDIPLWRYVDLPKFLSMLQHDALHFARSDSMEDKFEGSTTEPTRAAWREALRPHLSEESWRRLVPA